MADGERPAPEGVRETAGETGSFCFVSKFLDGADVERDGTEGQKIGTGPTLLWLWSWWRTTPV